MPAGGLHAVGRINGHGRPPSRRHSFRNRSTVRLSQLPNEHLRSSSSIGGRRRARTPPVARRAHMAAVNLTLGSQIVAARLQWSTKCPRVHRRGLTNFTKGGQKGAGFRCPERARISWGKAIAGSGVRGTDLSRSGQRCKDTPCLRKVQLGGYRPGRPPSRIIGVREQSEEPKMSQSSANPRGTHGAYPPSGRPKACQNVSVSAECRQIREPSAVAAHFYALAIFLNQY